MTEKLPTNKQYIGHDSGSISTEYTIRFTYQEIKTLLHIARRCKIHMFKEAEQYVTDLTYSETLFLCSKIINTCQKIKGD